MLDLVNKNFIEVRNLQETVGLDPTGIADELLVNKLEQLNNSAIIQHNGKLVPLKGFKGRVVHNLSLHMLADFTNNWNYRNNSIESICLHKSDKNPRALYCHFHNPTYRHLATHFAIGRHPQNNTLEVLQFLDTTVAAHHIGKANDFTISVDICNPSDVEIIEFANDFINKLEKTIGLHKKKRLISASKFQISDLKRYSVFCANNVSCQAPKLDQYAEQLLEGSR